jgi:predicted oxidoreductase
MDADVIVVGAGLAGLVATHELTSRGKRVALVDQENAANLGGQAFWWRAWLQRAGRDVSRRLSLLGTHRGKSSSGGLGRASLVIYRSQKKVTRLT